MSEQESAIERYMRRILDRSVQGHQRSNLLFQHWEGQEYPNAKYPIPTGLHHFAALCMTYGHVSEAFRRLLANPATRNHPNVEMALECNIVHAHKYHKDTPPDVLDDLIEEGNEYAWVNISTFGSLIVLRCNSVNCGS